MALSGNTVWEVRTAGSDSNGGGFVTGASGTDRSQQNGAQATLTTASVVHTTTTQINVAVGDFTVSAADVGNILQVTGGTATAGFYQITAADVGNNRWTVDRAVGTAGQTVAGAMGGALASPGKASGAAVASNNIYINAGTYTITSSSPNVSNGVLSVIAGTAAAPTQVIGYNATRNDDGTPPLLQFSGISTATVISLGANTATRNVIVDAASGATTSGITTTGSSTRIILCVARNCTVSGISGAGGNCHAIKCTTSVCEIGFLSIARAEYCCSSAGATGFSSNVVHIGCIAKDASGDGFLIGVAHNTFVNCSAYSCGGDGFDLAANTYNFFFNCIAISNGTYGVTSTSTSPTNMLWNCAFFGNSSGDVNANIPTASVSGKVTLTADPFVDPTNFDFRLNTTSGAGLAARAAGFPSTYLDVFAPTLNYQDIGAAQHQDINIGGLIAGGLVA